MDISQDEAKAAATALKETEKSNASLPPGGFIAIELSSNGCLGAPKLFHIRNFDTSELLSLQQVDDNERLLKVAEMLQNCIWEKDVDIKKFHEKEVVETLIEMYKIFVSDKLTDLLWELTDDDREYIKSNDPHAAERLAAYDDGTWKPRFDLDINTLKFHVLDPKTFKSTIKVTKPGFECEFTYPKYGDAIILKKFIDDFFKEDDHRYEKNLQVIKYRESAIRDFENGNTKIDIARLPNIPKNEYDEIKDYQIKKAATATLALKAMYIKSINGENIENLPLDKKLEIVNNTYQIDHNTFAQVEKMYDEMEICTDKNITAYDPVLRKVVQVPFRFYVAPLLECLSNGSTAGTDISFI